MTAIRSERPDDLPHIRVVNERAFGQAAEADIVDRVRRACTYAISLVAEENDRIVGHILFSPVIVQDHGHSIEGMGLAPMAVHPDLQRQGIGSALVRRGLDIVRAGGCPFVVVLGHPEFYPRFGFEPASKHGLRNQWEGVPEEAFMAVILDHGAMEGVSGVVRYRDEFDEAM
jgi:putative acetyltransferase